MNNAIVTLAARPAAQRRARVLLSVVGVLGFALLTALAAQIKVFTPLSPVPLTFQTLAVLLAGTTLGPWLGSASMLFYLLLGSTGYGVFAFGDGGAAALLGPTAGYLFGFVIAQPVVGLLTSASTSQAHATRRWLALAAAMVAGHGVIFVCGLAWLSVWANVGLAPTLAMGLWPFLPGAVAKTIAAVGLSGPALMLRRRFSN